MVRRRLDRYETDKRLVDALLYFTGPLGPVFEPCAGYGAIAQYFDPCVTADIDKTLGCDMHADARLVRVPAGHTVVTNPPFNLALPIAANLVRQAPCAFLLRISWMEPTVERRTFLSKYPPTGLIYCPRVSFTGNGKKDSVTLAWHLWNVPTKVPGKPIATRPINVYCL